MVVATLCLFCLSPLVPSTEQQAHSHTLHCACHLVTAVRTLTEGGVSTPERSRRSSSSQQQPEQGVNVEFSNLQGLRQGLAAAITGRSSSRAMTAAGGMCSDDVEIIVSGQVRLQCSPVRQRQQLSDAAQCNAEEAADEQVAQALAVAASRSPDRCRAAGRGKAAAAAMQQAADEKAAAAAAAALAAQTKPLKAALQEVHGMIAAMENMCHSSGHGGSGSSNCDGAGPAQVLTYKSSSAATAAAAAAGKAARAGSPSSCWQRQSSPVPRSHQHLPPQQQQRMRSPDRYRLRGQLKHVQEQLVKLEVKMNQAAAMQEGPCFCSTAADSMAARSSSPTRGSPGGKSMAGSGVLHSPDCRAGSGAISAAGVGCKGGCVRRVAGKRQVLVGRMQDEIGLLQRELAELREMMPGAYA